MSEDLIRRILNLGADRRQTKLWSMQEILLLNPEVLVSSRTLRSVLAGWNKVRKRKEFVHKESFIPNSLSIHQAFILSRYNRGQVNTAELKALKLWCCKQNIQLVADCTTDPGGWTLL
jgi:hypothetical protein